MERSTSRRPEIHRGVLSEKSDQFSLGVTWYFLRTGCLPFPSPTDGFRRRNSYSRPAPDLGGVSRSERRILERGAVDVSTGTTLGESVKSFRELQYAWMYATGSGISSSSIIVTSSPGSTMSL